MMLQIMWTRRQWNNPVEDIADSYSDDEASSLGPLKWPPAVGDHVTVNFDTGFKIGEITDIKENDKVRITFMHPKPFAQPPPLENSGYGVTKTQDWCTKTIFFLYTQYENLKEDIHWRNV